jgi:hypothetical protein
MDSPQITKPNSPDTTPYTINSIAVFMPPLSCAVLALHVFGASERRISGPSPSRQRRLFQP